MRTRIGRTFAGVLAFVSALPLMPQTANREISTNELHLIKSADLPFMSNGAFSLPSACTTDTLYFRVGEGTGLMAISRDGQHSDVLSKDAISDIANPIFSGYPFVTESDVYMFGHADSGTYEAKFRTPDGSEVKTPVVRERKYFIAHYKPDGKYVGLITLDLPFRPIQFGAFPSGGFLVAGEDRKSGRPEPRVALLRHDGQLDRYLDLQDDLEPQQFQSTDQVEGSRSPQPQSFAEARSIATAIMMSRIVPDGRDLLLVRSGTDRPVFRISAGGEVHSLRIQAPEQAVLTGVFASRDRLVGLYTRRRTDGSAPPTRRKLDN